MKQLVVIGNPIKHSLSPIMHNAAIGALKLEKMFHYEKLKVEEKDLKNFVEKIRSGEITGANVTIPYKTTIIKYLDVLTKEADLIGAVNTIYKQNDKVVGHNTDGIGCLEALGERGVETAEKKVVILGAGGAARAIAFAIALNNAKKLVILNRTVSKADELAKSIKNKIGTDVESNGLFAVGEVVKDTDVLINCTSLGMKTVQNKKIHITSTMLSKNITVMDIVYDPPQTKLLEEAKKAGCNTVNGIGMLVYQGAHSFNIWTGRKPPTNVMKNAILWHIKKTKKMKSNIALIGFMGVGKSAVGRSLAEKLDMNFIEIDDLIEKKNGRSILEIFEKEGETRFREMETEVVREVAMTDNAVISCGGGVVLNEINVAMLKENAIVVLLTASSRTIQKRTLNDRTRPLLNTRKRSEKINELLSSRRICYEKAADHIIDTTSLTKKEVTEKVLSTIKGNVLWR
ncbi:MAG: shikimate dehydrogenase [Candidatus Methanofastidiosia archaeon]